jgi:hypothetical protein
MLNRSRLLLEVVELVGTGAGALHQIRSVTRAKRAVKRRSLLLRWAVLRGRRIPAQRMTPRKWRTHWVEMLDVATMGGIIFVRQKLYV